MSKLITQIRMFFSATDELASERGAFRSVAEQLTDILEKSHNIHVKALAWPEDFRPGVHSYPQAEISTQLGEIDLYVGALGARFGDETPKAPSATEEEFRDQLARYQQDSTSVRVLFYFSKTVHDLDDVDPEQLRKVKEFKKSLKKDGVLYREFKDTDDFTKMIHKHIHGLIVDEWDKTRWLPHGPPVVPPASPPPAPPSPGTPSSGTPSSGATSSGSTTPTTPAPSTTRPAARDEHHLVPIGKPDSAELHEVDEPGLLEYADLYETATTAIRATMGRIAEHTEDVGAKIRARTEEINALAAEKPQVAGGRQPPGFTRKASEIANASAGDLEEFVGKMAPDVKEFKIQIRIFFSSYKSLTLIGPSAHPARSPEESEAIGNLVATIRTTREHTTGFQRSLFELPPMTKRLRRAKTLAAEVLGELIAQFAFAIDEAQALLT